MITERKTCRACGSSELVEVFDLGIQPPANDFAREGDARKAYAPLIVNYCNICSLAQLSVVYNPNILYADYPYVTSRSEMMRKHFHLIAAELNRQHGNLSECSVMEIGSNDGTFLEYLRNVGVKKVFGVEPAENLAAIANANGIETACAFFGVEFSDRANRVDFVRPDIIIARHVFAHTDDWKGFIAGLAACSHNETIIFIEVPDTERMLQSNSFDQIYHEHLSYVTPQAVEALLLETPFSIRNIVKYDIHGGSIGIILHKTVDAGSFGYGGPTGTDWLNFSARCVSLMENMADAVESYTKQGKTFAGYGASAKSSVWINAVGWTAKQIGFIVDSTPQKQGRISPGSNIPILPESELLKRMPDFCIIFSWNFADEIIFKNQDYIKSGGKFIIPIPHLKVWSEDSCPS